MQLFINKSTSRQVNFDISHIHDVLQQLTEPINYQLNHNDSLAYGIQITASFMMDLSFLSLQVYWLFYGKNSTPIMAAALFYLTRSILQSLFEIPKPQGLYWPYPGFPSLVVPYGSSSDFFYSGHVGFLTIVTLQWWNFWKETKRKSVFTFTVFWFALVSTIVMAFTMLIFRAHYTIDLVSGSVFAHYFYMLSQKYHKYIDYFFIKLFRRFCYKKEQNKLPKSKSIDSSICNS